MSLIHYITSRPNGTSVRPQARSGARPTDDKLVVGPDVSGEDQGLVWSQCHVVRRALQGEHGSVLAFPPLHATPVVAVIRAHGAAHRSPLSAQALPHAGDHQAVARRPAQFGAGGSALHHTEVGMLADQDEL